MISISSALTCQRQKPEASAVKARYKIQNQLMGSQAMISTKKFGDLPDGTPVTCYTIRNNEEEFVELLDYGAAIHSINVKDFNGEIGNVVLNVKDARDLAGRSKEGVTIGRCANRIAFGRYKIGQRIVQLEPNLNGHFVHGGSGNYAFRLFNTAINEESNSVCFSLRDNGEGGFDCAVDVQVCFTFGDDHRLEIAYELFPEGDTVLCPTNHAFFNLAGAGDVLNHKLRIYATQIAPKGEIGMPVGETKNVGGLPVDFTNRRTIREAMLSDRTGYFQRKPEQYDDCFLLTKKGFGEAAELLSPETGRMMRVYTDMPAVILYTPQPAAVSPEETRIGYSSVCLETQFVPNAINCPQYVSPLFRKGKKFKSRTVYEFITLFELREL
jgi:aldose 1-epimerase